MQRLESQGALFPRPQGPPPGLTATPAAVLALLFPVPGDLAVVLTQRTEHLGRHAGQVSFPGGRVEPGDASHLHAARRETEEELGIATADFELLGRLPRVYIPPSNYEVSPFVMYTPQRPHYSPSPGEVAAVFEVPLLALMQPEAFTTTLRDVSVGRALVGGFRYESAFIWGATAFMLDQLLTRIELRQQTDQSA